MTTTAIRQKLDLDRSDWTRVRFGDVVNKSNEKTDPSVGEVDRFVAGEHMETGELRIKSWGVVRDCDLGPAFHRRFRPGQVLYGSRRTYLRKVAYADFDGVCANTTFVCEPREPSVLLPALLPFVMSTERFHQHSIAESKGSVNPYVNWPDLAKFEFNLPPLDQQGRIASLLWAVERHRRHLQGVQESLHLTQRTHCLHSYQKTKGGSPMLPIPQVAEVTMGRQKSPKYAQGNSPRRFLSVANVGRLRLDLDKWQEMDFTEDELKRYRVQPGDIVLTEGDLIGPENVGRPALVSEELGDVCFQNTLIRFRPNTDLDPMYSLAILEGMRIAGVFAAAANTTTVSHLGLGRFRSLEFPFAERSVQLQVAEQLAAQQEAEDGLDQEMKSITSLRDSLLRGLLQ